MTEETGLEYRCHALDKVYGFIASEQIRNGMRPVHISQRWARLWLKISDRSWRRATERLSSLGYVGRLIKRGRGRGSMYWINWNSANSLAELYSKPNGNTAKKIGHKARKNGHISPYGEYRNRPLVSDMRSQLRSQNTAKMTTILPNGRSKAGAERPASKESGNGRSLINVNLSGDIFEAAQLDPELLEMCIQRGMVREVPAASANGGEPGFEVAKAVVDDLLKTKADRYLEAVAQKEASGNGEG